MTLIVCSGYCEHGFFMGECFTCMDFTDEDEKEEE